MTALARPRICAHAGAENTPPDSLESVLAGAQAGADWVELDLRFTSEGTPVLSHDALGAPPAEGWVTLEAALAALARYPEVGINLDVKDFADTRDIPTPLTLGEVPNPTYFTGLGRRSFGAFLAAWPQVEVASNQLPLGYAWRSAAGKVESLRRMKAEGASSLNLSFTLVDEALMAVAREAEMPVRVWTVDRDDDLRRMIALGVDAITTNRPRRLKELLG